MGSPNHAQSVRVSLKLKAIAFISLLVLVIGGGLSWYFLRQTRDVLTEELQRRALSLAKNLAHNSTYGILIEDAQILQELIKGMLQEDSVLSIHISNAQGKVLAQGIREGQHAVTLPFDTALLSQVSGPAVQTQRLGTQELYRAVAPVERTEAPASQREAGLDVAISLLGVPDHSEPRTTPETVRLGSVQLLLSPATMQAEVRKTFATGIAWTLIVILLGVLVAVLFYNSTLKPIQAMARAASHIAAGELSQRVEAKGHDEIGILAATFNDMTVSLQQRLTELSALHAIGLVISATLDLDQLMHRVLAAIVEHLGYDYATMFQIDHHRQTLVQGRIAGVADDIQAQLQQMTLSLGEEGGFYARVVRHGEPVLMADIAPIQGQGYRPVIELLGCRSFVAVPLKVEGRTLGVLSIGYIKSKRAVSVSDQQILTTVANQLAIGITNASAYHQIEQLNLDLEKRVQERMEELQRQHAQLQEVNRALEVANRHKSEFLANMSHELRTPLNAVIGFSEVLLERMFGELNEKQAEYLDDILGSGKYLLSLINDILDLAKIEAGRLDLELRTFDLKPLLENSLVMVKERAQAHGITLSLETSDDLHSLNADERKVKQIVFNLLSNAVKFTPNGGQVGLRATTIDHAVQIAVWDTGIGIAAEDQQRIFDEFQQARSGLTGKTEGTGLGLTLTKRFVELHGGTLEVESVPDQGSTFTVTLPVAGLIAQRSVMVVQEEGHEPATDATRHEKA